MDQIPNGACLTCLGTGEVSSERGLSGCPDRDGSGNLGPAYRRTERRLREIERRLRRSNDEGDGDIAWLIDELRRHRSALVKVMTAAQDGQAQDPLFQEIQFAANDVLGVYEEESN